jgi:acyl-coenzyme A synthetase/AMP-(fatty) acid ligase
MNPTNLQSTREMAIINAFSGEKILAFHKSECKTQNDFICDVLHLSTQLPNVKHIVNLCQNRYFFAVAFCALALRKMVNLLPNNKQWKTLENLSQEYDAPFALVDCEEEFPLTTIHIAECLSNTNRHPVTQCPSIPFTQLVAIAFTSGSTGKPKANPKIWGTLVITAQLLGARIIEENNQDLVIVGTIPAQHMYGLETTIMLPLQAGLMLDSSKPFFPFDIQHTLATYTTKTLLITTPIHLRTMINSNLEMAEIYGLISATAPLDIQTAEKSEKLLSTKVWEIFGCTEAGSVATRQPTQSSQWQLLNGFRLHQQDDNTIATASHLMEEAIIQDQIKIESPEHFTLSGRATDLINIGGKRSSLADLTIQLLEIEGVEDAVVFLPNTEEVEIRTAAFVVSRLSEKELVAALALKIDPTFIPRPLKIINSIPRNETGKISREIIEQLWKEHNAN